MERPEMPARFRRVSEKVHSGLLREYRARYLGMPICSNAPLLGPMTAQLTPDR
jgi:hypothetical protein